MPLRLLLMLMAGCGLATAVWAGAQNAAGSTTAATATPKARLLRVGTFKFPIYVAGTPTDPKAFYVLERTGRIWIVRNGKKVSRPFLDIHKSITIGPTSEQGLLSMAFAPNYAKSRRYYVYYTNRQGDIRVDRFLRSKRDPSRTDFSSRRTVLAIAHRSTDKHYAGQLQFGPRDHDLYVSVGDGGVPADASDTAQHLNTLLGKILRIDVSHGSGRHAYSIPHGNPFVHHHNALPQIFDYGLRNPYRFSFDPKTGAAWLTDVGENTWEEIDYRRAGHLAGVNFGWPRFEGPAFFRNVSAPGAVRPTASFHHQLVGGGRGGELWCAIIGGYVDRDPTLKALGGRYLFADHCTGRVYSARINGKGKAYGVGPTGPVVKGLVTSLGEDAQNRIYICSEDGSVYRFVAR